MPQVDYAATLRTVAALVKDAERALGTHASVGVGAPGSGSRLIGVRGVVRLRGVT